MTSEKYQISQKEIDRRYAAVQGALQKRGLDALIIQTHSEIFDMYLRYLTGMKAVPDPYGFMVLVPAVGEMYVLVQGGAMDPDAPVPENLKNHHVGKFGTTTSVMCFHYTDSIPARYVSDEIRKNHYRRIGFAGGGLISLTTANYLRENLPECTFEDFTDDFDNIIAVKSEEELVLLRKTVDSHCEIAAAIPGLIYPGRSLREIRADLYAMCEAQRCELAHNLFINAGPHGKFAVPGPVGDPDYVIQKGDAVCYLLEVAAEGGMYAEVGRTLLLYDPSRQEVEDYELYVKGERWLTEQIKPGMTCAEIVDLNDKWAEENGFGKVTRMAGHGQGYGLMERPAFRKDDNMIIRENMFYAMHAGGTGGTRKPFFVCNNYIVRKDKSELMTWLPCDLQVLDR